MKDGKIEDAGFIGSGCAISQASASLMIDLVKGRTVEDAHRLISLYFQMIKGKITPEELDDLEDALDIELDQEEHDTLTGLVFDALGMIPDDGEQDITLEAEGMRIHVTSIADHQVNAAQVWLLPKEAPTEDEE